MYKLFILVEPGGMESKVEVTNDGLTILKSNIGIDNPVAKILIDMSEVINVEVDDGTTSVTILGKKYFISFWESVLLYYLC